MRKINFWRNWINVIVMAAFFMIFFLVVDSFAKEKKHGAELLIQKRDGEFLKTELLAVKETKLILMDSVSMSGITLDINEIKSIQIVKKSKFFQGLGYGLLIGAGGGALLGLLSGDDPPGWFSMSAGQKALYGGLALGILGAPVGGIYGAIKGVDESVILEGKSQEEIKLILDKLKAKSRFPQKQPENFNTLISSNQKKKEGMSAKEVLAQNQENIKEEFSQKKRSRYISRIHITLEGGYFDFQTLRGYKGIFNTLGFGDDEINWFFGLTNVSDYPSVRNKRSKINFRYARLEYSISRNFSLGFMYSPLGKSEVKGRKLIGGCGWEPDWWQPDIYLKGKSSGNFYSLTASFMPIPEPFLKKLAFKTGVGLGISTINIDFKTSQDVPYTEEGDSIVLSKNSFGFMAFVEFDYYFNRHWSIGLSMDYKYLPVKIDHFQLAGIYRDCDYVPHQMMIDIPDNRENFGGFGAGINFGIHL